MQAHPPVIFIVAFAIALIAFAAEFAQLFSRVSEVSVPA